MEGDKVNLNFVTLNPARYPGRQEILLGDTAWDQPLCLYFNVFCHYRSSLTFPRDPLCVGSCFKLLELNLLNNDI